MKLGQYVFYPRRYKDGRRIWWYYFRDENGNKKANSTGKTTEAEAEEFILELVAQDYLRKKAQKEDQVYFGNFAKDFFKWPDSKWIRRQHARGKDFKEITARMRKGHLENYLIPEFGTSLLRSIKAQQVEDYLLSLKLANSTRNGILYTMSIVMKEAVRQGKIEVNPMAQAEPFSTQDYARRDILTREELDKAFPADMEKFKRIWPKTMYGVLFHTIVCSSMRNGEVRALTWDRIVWDVDGKGTVGGIRIMKAIDTLGRTVDPKKKEIRGVLIPNKALALLRWWHGKTKYKKPTDYVFTNWGKKLAKKTIERQLIPGLERAEVKINGRNIVVHSLRHTYNTIMRDLLIAGNVPEEYLRWFTGHKNVTMTDRYDHPEIDRRMKAVISVAPQINQFFETNG